MCSEPNIVVSDCGMVDYESMLIRQRDLFEALVACKRAGKPISEEYLLLVEHPDVITLGRHARHGNILASSAFLQHEGIPTVEIERGGDVTYHGPGQLVVYPIIDLSRRSMGVKDYVATLEEAVIRTLAHWNINGERVDDATGVWIGKGTTAERKICAIGIRCSRYITMHGLALNVNTDLSKFGLINPCGFVDKGVTSIKKEVGGEVDMAEVKKRFVAELLTLLR